MKNKFISMEIKIQNYKNQKQKTKIENIVPQSKKKKKNYKIKENLRNISRKKS